MSTYTSQESQSLNDKLRQAIHDSNLDDIKRLVVIKGVYINTRDANGITALQVAALKGNIDDVKMLLNNGADVSAEDQWGDTALHVAARRCDTALVQLLLNNGANINEKGASGKHGETALHQAARGGKTGIIELLLKNGANIEAKDDEWGRMALHVAAREGKIKVVQLLLEKGANVNAKDNAGCTALYEAAWGGHTDIIKLLLGKGANVNAKDNGDETALHKAASGGHRDAVKLLLEKGADVNAKNIIAGNTPLDYVREQEAEQNSPEHRECIRLLQEAAKTRSNPHQPESQMEAFPNPAKDVGRKEADKRLEKLTPQVNASAWHQQPERSREAEATKDRSLVLAGETQINRTGADLAQSPEKTANPAHAPALQEEGFFARLISRLTRFITGLFNVKESGKEPTVIAGGTAPVIQTPELGFRIDGMLVEAPRVPAKGGTRHVS